MGNGQNKYPTLNLIFTLVKHPFMKGHKGYCRYLCYDFCYFSKDLVLEK